MSLRTLGLASLGVALAAFGSNSANAQSVRVERSGATYHVAVCPHGNPFGTARCHAHVVTDARGNPLLGKPLGASPNAGTPSGYGPNDLRSAYGLASASTSLGGGKIIAIVDAYGYPRAEADLQTYRAQYGLGSCTVKSGCLTIVNQSGGTTLPRTDTGWDQEQALDLDMASAICPNCKILLVQATSNSFANLSAAVDYAASVPGVVAISNSYGGSEYSSETTDESHYNHPTIAVTVSSGDNGYGVQFPAASQYVTAVGGTHLVLGQPESAWSGAGSGCSAYIPKPSWQTDQGCARRTVADVSAVADPNTGVAVYGPINRSVSGWQVFGGTSVAAPLIAGVYAISGSVVPTSTTYKNANYGTAGTTANLHDVQSGSNGSCGGTYLCTAGQGYDGPTGLGTPSGTGAF
jgi:subtilase family serine protease